MKWGSKQWLFITAIVVLMLAVIASGCCSLVGKPVDRVMNGLGYTAVDSTAATPAVHGTIDTGARVQVKQASVGPDGGKITVDQAGSPVEGLTIDVPAGAYPTAHTFTVSTAPVTGHTFGQYFNPVTPLISVDGAHDFADDIMLVTIPINVSDDQFAMAFYYDDANKTLEGLPVVSVDDHSITVATRHFSDIIVSTILKSVLDALPVADSGFRPGQDDWQFVNNGSYAAPDGLCAGQSVSMMWYYTQQKQQQNAPQLYGRYDDNGRTKTPLLGGDDTLGYRFASDIHSKMDQKKYFKSIGNMTFKVNGSTTYNLFKYSILLTGEPQQVFIWSAQNDGHAIVCYKVSGDTMYIADPNYPGKERTIKLDGTKLMPYSSGANSQDIAKRGVTLYPRINYIAKSGLISWDLVGTEYAKVGDGTIGDDIFPEYTTEVWLLSDDGNKSSFEYDGGKNLADKAVSVDGKKVAFRTKDLPGTVSGIDYGYILYTDNEKTSDNIVTLTEGHNRIGVEAYALVKGNYTWLGFDWFDLYYKPTETQGPRVPFRDYPDVTVPPAPYPLIEYIPAEGAYHKKSYSYYVDSSNRIQPWGKFKDYYVDSNVVCTEGTSILDPTTGLEHFIGYKYDYNQDGSRKSIEYYDANGIKLFEDNYDSVGNLVERKDYSSDGSVHCWEYYNGKLQSYEEFGAYTEAGGWGKSTLKETYDANGKLIDSQK